MTRQELIDNIRRKQSFLCVGLDTDLQKVPEHLLTEEDPIFAFNKAIIDATAPYCVAYKPNLAFYEAFGVKGLMAFEKTVKYLKQHYPDQFIIADAKRGDIGNTSKMYARTFFGEYDVDALTVAPYMGEDSVTPFIDSPQTPSGSPLKGENCSPSSGEGRGRNHWVILLALTSNKGSLDFQLTEDKNGERLFEKVIRKSREWGNDENLMYVVGATRGELFQDIRRVAPKAFLLVPGIGAQGGSLEEVCRYGMIEDIGLLVNSSRAIIYADKSENFAQVAAEKAKEVALQMAELLNSK
ncbi:MAG: orotidine-5'-phosphate decarboxylase [Bacteroidaceae bacterium]|nr:orotidine-5'-phosphate decarboxylase [Bacteroidaceae bacterium]